MLSCGSIREVGKLWDTATGRERQTLKLRSPEEARIYCGSLLSIVHFLVIQSMTLQLLSGIRIVRSLS